MRTVVTETRGGHDESHTSRRAIVDSVNPRRETAMFAPITIRRSTQGDRAGIMRLAALDDRAVPAGDALLAFVGDELRAALSLCGGRIVADPFHLTQDIVDLLVLRAAQELEAGTEQREGRAARLHPVVAA
jgi:hypothetical protein